jgi:LPS export ABC transporter protein LptC
LAEYKDTTLLDMYEGSHKSWVLKTKYLVKWPRTDLVRAKPVDLIVYDSLGKDVFKVTSDSGSVDENISFLVASGHVHGHSIKGVDIRTDSLRWNKAINQISTEAHVRVVSEDGDILTGKGFISDAKLDNWQILSNVKGVFQKVTERVEQSDKPSPKPKADSTAKPQVTGPGAANTSPPPNTAPAANGAPSKGAAPDSGKSGSGGAK